MNEADLIPKPKTKFLRVKCKNCGREQTIFSAASSRVKCFSCGQELAEPKASKIKLKGKLVKELK